MAQPTGATLSRMSSEPGPFRKRRLSPFWRHFVEMLVVMQVGMVAASAVLCGLILGLSFREATEQHPTAALLVMTGGMTVPMVAWMLHRGMGARNAAEMAAAMAVPVVPFLCLVWFDVTRSAWCGAYCAVAVLAMLGLMLVRRGEYSTEGAHAVAGSAPG